MFRDPEPDPNLDVPISPLAQLRADVDAVLRLILEPHDGATDTDWKPTIASMLTRGAGTARTVRGALESARVIDEDTAAALLNSLPDPTAASGPAEA